MNNSAVRTFKERYESLAGKVHMVPDAAGAAAVIMTLLQDAGATRIALAALPHEIADAVAADASALGIEVLREPFSSSDLPREIDRVQVGVTGAAFAIAQSGTLAEVAANDAVRLVSSLPRTHIGIVRAADVVDRFEEAAPRLRSLFLEHDGACAVSFISGPSRTGDIELILTLGIHGPESAHAIIVDS